MIKLNVFACSLVVALGFSSLAAAEIFEEKVGTYDAVISRIDRENSVGQPLISVGAVLEQDRTNVHQHKLLQNGDEVDEWLEQPHLRHSLKIAADETSNISMEIRNAILSGEDVKIRVHIYALGDGVGHVEIDLVD